MWFHLLKIWKLFHNLLRLQSESCGYEFKSLHGAFLAALSKITVQKDKHHNSFYLGVCCYTYMWNLLLFIFCKYVTTLNLAKQMRHSFSFSHDCVDNLDYFYPGKPDICPCLLWKLSTVYPAWCQNMQSFHHHYKNCRWLTFSFFFSTAPSANDGENNNNKNPAWCCFAVIYDITLFALDKVKKTHTSPPPPPHTHPDSLDNSEICAEKLTDMLNVLWGVLLMFYWLRT